MLEDSIVMEKKGQPRQSSNVTKPNAAFERKNDANTTARYHGRYSRKRDNGIGRGTPSELSNRKPLPQKNRSALDKRPRQRGGFGGRQREEVAETEDAEADSSIQHRRPRKGDASYLLNFTFAERGNAQTRHHRPRLWKKSYSKEQYLQANYQFVVKDTGDYSVQACDPDALVSWDLVQQVRTFSYGPTTCPICLHPPAAGKITRCGHVYCWACILHYLSLDDKGVRRCPICFDDVDKAELRSVKVVQRQEHKVGDTITLKLMKRARDSTYAVPCALWEDRQGRPHHIHDEVSTDYSKVLVASAEEIQRTVIEEERQGLKNQLKCAEDSEICFIETALLLLTEREASLQDSRTLEQQLQAASVVENLAPGKDDNSSTHSETGWGASGGDGGSAKTRSLPPQPHFPVATKSMPRKVLHASKILKEYSEAFEELEGEEEGGSGVSGELSDHEDSEDADSLMSLSSPTPDTSLSPREGSVPSDDGFATAALVADVGSEMTMMMSSDLTTNDELMMMIGDDTAMTTEEAVEQLAVPGEGDSGGEVAQTTTPSRTPNSSKPYFYFYQASDGQHIYMHSLNARCLCYEYGSLENGPHTITAKIVDKEIAFMTEDLRKRIRYLSHVPKACEFQVMEVQLQPPVVSPHTLRHFTGELKRRAQYRQKVRREDRRLARKQNIQEKISYGIYPEVQLALDNPDHFPAPVAEGIQRSRHCSLTDSPLPDPPCHTEPSEEVNSVPQSVPPGKVESSSPATPCAFSFAAALKRAKQPVPTAWGPTPTTTPAVLSTPTPGRGGKPKGRADSDDSDNEDRVPVPTFKNSFFCDATATLELAHKTVENGDCASKGGKKKKRKEKKLLFSTDMMRR